MLTKSKRKWIGNFRQKVTVQEVTETSDGAGGATESWAGLSPAWTPRVNIKPVSGVQRLELESQKSKITHTIQARFDSRWDNKKRIKYDGRTLNIQYVLNEDEYGRYIEMGAVE